MNWCKTWFMEGKNKDFHTEKSATTNHMPLPYLALITALLETLQGLWGLGGSRATCLLVCPAQTLSAPCNPRFQFGSLLHYLGLNNNIMRIVRTQKKRWSDSKLELKMKLKMFQSKPWENWCRGYEGNLLCCAGSPSGCRADMVWRWTMNTWTQGKARSQISRSLGPFLHQLNSKGHTCRFPTIA